MPKCIETPPPDDEPRYLTVVHPYPLNANLDLPADRRTLALWLACCADKDVLLAMYHRPASPSIIIIEVDRDFDRFDDLLGMHSWSEFLLNPMPEESDKSSKIFWCAHISGRSVQKHGWKRVDIEGHWFEGWRKQNSKIRYPYPQTTYCDVPSEAKTGEPLCHPLPQKIFPAPPRLSAPLATRISDATPGKTTHVKKKLYSLAMISRNAQSPPPHTPVSVTTNYRATQIACAAPLSLASRLSIKQPIPQIGAYQPFDWSDEPPTPTTSSISGSLRSDGCKSPPPSLGRDPGGPVDPTQQYEYYEEDKPKRTVATAMGDFFGDVPTLARNSDARGQGVQDEYPEGGYESLWVGYNDPRREAPTRIRSVKKVDKDEKRKEEWICDEHGPMCSPGICKARASYEFGVRKELEKKQREDRKWLARVLNKANAEDSLPSYGNGPKTGNSEGDNSTDESSGTEGGARRTRDDHTPSMEPSPPPASPSGWDEDDNESEETDEDGGERDEMRSVTSARTSTTAVTSTTSSGQRSLMSVRTTASFSKASSGPVVDLTTAALAAQSKKSKSNSQYSPAGRRTKPVSSDSHSTSTAVSSAASTSSAQTNFPSYDNTDWGDSIAIAQAKNVTALAAESKKSKSKSQYPPVGRRTKPAASSGDTHWGNPIAKAQAKNVGKKPGSPSVNSILSVISSPDGGQISSVDGDDISHAMTGTIHGNTYTPVSEHDTQREDGLHPGKGSTPYSTANEAYTHALRMETPLQDALANIGFSGEYILQVGFNPVALHEGLLIEEIFLSLNGDLHLPTLNDQVVCEAFASIFTPFPGVVCTQEHVYYLPVDPLAHGYPHLSSLGAFKVRTASNSASASASSSSSGGGSPGSDECGNSDLRGNGKSREDRPEAGGGGEGGKDDGDDTGDVSGKPGGGDSTPDPGFHITLKSMLSIKTGSTVFHDVTTRVNAAIMFDSSVPDQWPGPKIGVDMAEVAVSSETHCETRGTVGQPTYVLSLAEVYVTGCSTEEIVLVGATPDGVFSGGDSKKKTANKGSSINIGAGFVAPNGPTLMAGFTNGKGRGVEETVGRWDVSYHSLTSNVRRAHLKDQTYSSVDGGSWKFVPNIEDFGRVTAAKFKDDLSPSGIFHMWKRAPAKLEIKIVSCWDTQPAGLANRWNALFKTMLRRPGAEPIPAFSNFICAVSTVIKMEKVPDKDIYVLFEKNFEGELLEEPQRFKTVKQLVEYENLEVPMLSAIMGRTSLSKAVHRHQGNILP